MIYASTMVYGLARALGHAEAIREVRQHVQWARERGAMHPLFPCAHVLSNLRELDDVAQHIDAGATCIAKARSRAMHAALKSGADVWVSVDDDVQADVDTLRALVELARQSEEIAVAPCLLRRTDRKIVNVWLMPGATNVAGAADIEWGGFGLVACHRRALERIHSGCVMHQEMFRDDDQEVKASAFHEIISDGEWFGEDRSFFERAGEAAVGAAVLLTGSTTHAHQTLACADTLTLDRFDTPGLRLTHGGLDGSN